MALLLIMVSETLSNFYFEHDIRTSNIFILADYYTNLVFCFRFFVIKENLGGGGGYIRLAVWKNSLSLKSRCARDSD